jgi:hypothetical protein
MRMKRAIAVGLVLGAVFALAQVRTVTVREVDILPRKAEVDIRPDGGCLLTAYATVVLPSIEVPAIHAQYAFNGARCTAVKDAIVKAAKKDLGVGDGTDP